MDGHTAKCRAMPVPRCDLQAPLHELLCLAHTQFVCTIIEFASPAVPSDLQCTYSFFVRSSGSLPVHPPLTCSVVCCPRELCCTCTGTGAETCPRSQSADAHKFCQAFRLASYPVRCPVKHVSGLCALRLSADSFSDTLGTCSGQLVSGCVHLHPLVNPGPLLERSHMTAHGPVQVAAVQAWLAEGLCALCCSAQRTLPAVRATLPLTCDP